MTIITLPAGALPDGFVLADVADFVRMHEVVERGECLVDRGVLVVLVELVQVDVVGLQPRGITVRAHWGTLDELGRTAFLRTRQVRVIADKTHFEFHGGLLAESEAVPGTLEDAQHGEIS